MLYRYIFYIAISAICSFLYFFITSNLLYSALLFVSGLAILFIFLDEKVKIFLSKERKTRECVLFINNFIITLSMNQSIMATYQIVKESFSKKLSLQAKMIENMSEEEQIHYLRHYFNLSVYDVFLNLLDQYIYNGGDILKIAQILLFDVRKTEESLDNHISILTKKCIEFLTLWGMTFVIVIILKVSLSEFFSSMFQTNLFIYGLLAFFGYFYLNLILFSIHGFSLNFIEFSKKEITKEKRRKNEKNKASNRNTK